MYFCGLLSKQAKRLAQIQERESWLHLFWKVATKSHWQKDKEAGKEGHFYNKLYNSSGFIPFSLMIF